MPPSERKKLRQEISGALFQLVCLDVAEGGDGFNDQTLELLEVYQALVSTRYLSARQNIPRSPEQQFKVFNLCDKAFYTLLRVTKPTFDFLVRLIQDHAVFQSKSTRKQRDVVVQLAVALEWYGGFGNGNSVARIALGFGIGEGTVSVYVRRVQRALLRHYNHFIRWPSKERRAVSSAYHRERYGREGIVGFVDGTHVNFDQKPAIDGSLHFNRKSRYSFNVQVVNDEDKRLLFVYTGWPGSCNDSSIFAKTPIVTCPDQYFSREEYLVGDSGFAISERLITPYKSPAALQRENTIFNEVLSSARVVNENAIGLLKNRWMSLKGIRTQLNTPKDFEHVNNHILACAMLHNIGLILHDNWMDESNDEDNDANEPTGPPQHNDGGETSRGNLKRERLKRVLLYGGGLEAISTRKR